MNIAPTTRFVILLAGCGLVPLLAMPGSGVWVALLADICLVTLWLLDGLHMGRMVSLEVRRELPEKLPLMRDTTVRLHVTNSGRVPVWLRLRDAPPEQFVVSREELECSVAPGETSVVQYRAVPVRRGEHAFGDTAVWIEGGLRLSARRVEIGTACTVGVYPDLHLVREYDTLTRRRHLNQMGIRQTRKLGAGREFDRLREYHSDDDYRHINWKATARRGKPISTVYQVERGQDILLAIDTSRMMGLAAGGRTKLDASVEAALFLARAALYYEDNVGLVTFSTGVDSYLPSRRGNSQIGRIVRMLYAAAPHPTVVNFRQTFQFLASRCRRRALVVCFTDLLDEDHARDLLRHLPLVRRRHLPIFVTISDQGIVDIARRVPATEKEAYEAVVAEEMLAERQNLVRALEKQGALVVDAASGELSLATVNAYLQVKAAQLL